MRLTLGAVAFLVVAGALPANAQTAIVLPPREASLPIVGTVPAPRIQVQVQLQTRGSGNSTADEQRAAQEALRRSLYDVAVKECSIIVEVFKADCRMLTLNVTSNILDRGGPGVDMITTTANITFELMAKTAARP